MVRSRFGTTFFSNIVLVDTVWSVWPPPPFPPRNKEHIKTAQTGGDASYCGHSGGDSVYSVRCGLLFLPLLAFLPPSVPIRRQLSVKHVELTNNKCDPFSQKGPLVAGVDTTYRQRSDRGTIIPCRPTILYPPLDCPTSMAGNVYLLKCRLDSNIKLNCILCTFLFFILFYFTASQSQVTTLTLCENRSTQLGKTLDT